MKQTSEPHERAEQLFFDDAAVDGLMGVVMALAEEHYVLRDRMRRLEQQLARTGHLNIATLDAAPPPEEAIAAQDDAASFAQALLRPLLGVQDAAGASGRFSLKRRKLRHRGDRS